MGDLSIPADAFPEITEIWRIGPNQIEVSVQATSKRPQPHVVRVTAYENIRSGATPGYFAHYETQVTVRDMHNNERLVWAEADYPWQDGETPEECLNAALVWVSGG